jgi:hypothetical protein
MIGTQEEEEENSIPQFRGKHPRDETSFDTQSRI